MCSITGEECCIILFVVNKSCTKFSAYFYFASFIILFPLCLDSPSGSRTLVVEVPQLHSLRLTTLGRTPLDEWSARRRVLYLTTLNTHKRQRSMSPVALESTIPKSELSHINALDCVTNGIGTLNPRVNSWLKTGVDSRVNERNVGPVTLVISNRLHHAMLLYRIIYSGVAREWQHPLKRVSASAGQNKENAA